MLTAFQPQVLETFLPILQAFWYARRPPIPVHRTALKYLGFHTHRGNLQHVKAELVINVLGLVE
jgi:hypothetical protein